MHGADQTNATNEYRTTYDHLMRAAFAVFVLGRRFGDFPVLVKSGLFVDVVIITVFKIVPYPGRSRQYSIPVLPDVNQFVCELCQAIYSRRVVDSRPEMDVIPNSDRRVTAACQLEPPGHITIMDIGVIEISLWYIRAEFCLLAIR